MAQRFSSVGLCVVLGACGGSSPAGNTKASGDEAESASAGERQNPPEASSESERPVGTQLLRDVEQSPKVFKVESNDGGKGLGKFHVTVDGQEIWPPKGEGCAELERCCTDLTAQRGELALACLLATGRDGDCATARQTSSQVALEQNIVLPASCKE